MAYDKNNNRRQDLIHSIKISAGHAKTYFFDLRKNRDNEVYLIINESTRKQDGEGYDRHKLFVYKEDILRFKEGLDGIINHITSQGLADLSATSNFKSRKPDNDLEDMHTDKDDTDYRATVSEPAAIHKIDEEPQMPQDGGESDKW